MENYNENNQGNAIPATPELIEQTRQNVRKAMTAMVEKALDKQLTDFFNQQGADADTGSADENKEE